MISFTFRSQIGAEILGLEMQWWIQGGRLGDPKTYECSFIHHDFVQFGKQHLRHKDILPSIVLSWQCCEVYFIYLIVVNP